MLLIDFLGDETDLWIDVVEWLIHKKVSNIVVGRRDNTLRSNVRVPFIKNHNNVVVHDHQDVKKLLAEAQKMGPLSAAFYISTVS